MAKEHNSNLDPLTREPGSHPVGTGVGAAIGGAGAGAAAGMVAGPAGALAGAVAGAVGGAFGGRAAAEAINPTAEEAWWKDNYQRESYYETGRAFDDYAPAYRLGTSGRIGYSGSFETYEGQLAEGWDARRGSSTLSWQQARGATRAAWDRVDRQILASQTPASTIDQQGLDPTGDRRSMNALGADETLVHESGGYTRTSDDAVSAMSATENPEVDDDVIETLNDLLESCRDGEYGYRECAEHIKQPDLKAVLQSHEQDCRSAGAQLQTLITQLGGKPDEGGTVGGALHRGWVSVRGSLMGNSDQAMMDEAERGEDIALSRYRKALKQTLPPSVRDMIERQFAGAQRNHDQIKALRDTLKSTH